MRALRHWVRGIADGVRNMIGHDAAALHQRLVDELVSRKLIQTSAIEAAFRAVPRHPFLPGVALDAIYSDEPVVTHYNSDRQPISSSSQPAIMAIMLEMLALKPGQRVLEIGAGTGYNAALMAQVVGAAGSIVSIDIDEDVIASAEDHLRAAEIAGVRLVLGDGALGCAVFAPYDRVILTVGANDIALAWRDQLVEGGLLVLPLSLRATPRVFAFRRQSDTLMGVSATMGGFMPLRGIGAPPEHSKALPRAGGTLWTDGAVAVDVEAIDALLGGAYRDLPTGVRSDVLGTWSGYALWLELTAPEFVHAPFRTDYDGKSVLKQALGLARDGQIALIVPAREGQSLMVRQFGGGEALALRLIELLQAWQAAGSPRFEEDVVVSAYPLEMAIKAAPGSIRIVRQNMQYIVTIKESYL